MSGGSKAALTPSGPAAGMPCVMAAPAGMPCVMAVASGVHCVMAAAACVAVHLLYLIKRGCGPVLLKNRDYQAVNIKKRVFLKT